MEVSGNEPVKYLQPHPTKPNVWTAKEAGFYRVPSEAFRKPPATPEWRIQAPESLSAEGTWTMTESEFKREIAEAWDEGAIAGWKQSGEGFNAEYPDESTGECSVDLTTNPHRSRS